MNYSVESIDERIMERIEATKAKIKAAKAGNYFKRRNPEEWNKLIPEFEKNVDELKSALEPWYTTSWQAALNASWRAARDFIRVAKSAIEILKILNEARDSIRDVALRAAIMAAGDKYQYAVRDATWDVVIFAIRDATWELIRNIEGYRDNPYEPLYRMCALGARPRGFRKVNGVEKFVVDLPSTIYKADKLACWVEGDREILYMHEWYEDCNKTKPVIPPRKIE
jgi:hypothetical protein